MWIRRRRGERGAVAVEAALVTPVVVLLLFGIIEMSLLMRDVVSTSSSVRAGSRVASSLASAGKCNTACSPSTAPALAQAAASGIERSGSSLGEDALKSMIVYQAGTNGFPLGKTDATCGGANCVAYTWDTVANKFVYSSGSWDTSQINACVNDPARFSVGIAIQAKHEWVTGLFGSPYVMGERSVMQFEPLPNEQCKPGQHG